MCSKWMKMIDDKAKPLSVTQSTVRCAGSNELLSEKNQAVMFPDNRVYGLSHVQKNMARNSGKFITLSVGMAFEHTEMKKVYFL